MDEQNTPIVPEPIEEGTVGPIEGEEMAAPAEGDVVVPAENEAI